MLHLSYFFKLNQKKFAINCDLPNIPTFSYATQQKNRQILGLNYARKKLKYKNIENFYIFRVKSIFMILKNYLYEFTL